ncbi:MAG: hypothetical protein IH899_07125, partial [Planctomycetes bacterium]|nr:hypothetical protein [Planctomycetota bacterium]
MSYAKMVAKGHSQIAVEPFPQLVEEYAEQPDLLSAEYVQLFRVQQEWFPSLNLVPADPELYYAGVKLNKQIERHHLKQLFDCMTHGGIITANKKVPEKIVAGMLHEALEGYIRNIEKTGAKLECGPLKPTQRKRISLVNILKQHHEDCLLHELNYDYIEAMVAHWRNRPPTKRGGRMKPISAKHHIDELFRFLNWLDLTDRYRWELPKGFNRINRKITALEEDNQKTQLITKAVYSPKEFSVINEYANEFDRLLLYVGINCAFGAAEIGRLTIDEVLFNHDHEYPERLNFETTKEDSFIRVMRPKSGVFGEWLLWPETADILR